jgi:hypothetical protein
MERAFLMAITLHMIPHHDIRQAWCVAGPLIEKAIKYCHGETTLENLYEDLLNDERKLLTIHDGHEMIAAVILSMNYFPEKKVCQISFAGGKRMEEWSDQGLPTVERIAREAGADAVYIQGRRGWLRKFRDYGYDERATVIGKDLKE